jgi:multiple sugar transport system permease protein
MAELEGANFWQKIWLISIPRLRPVIVTMLLLTIIASLQVFDWPQLMTGGGPGGSSRTVVMYMYSMLNNLHYADATALAIYLFVVIMIITVIYRTLFKSDPDT